MIRAAIIMTTRTHQEVLEETAASVVAVNKNMKHINTGLLLSLMSTVG